MTTGAEQRALGEAALAGRWIAGILFLCFIYVLPWWAGQGDWNQNSRLDMTMAIVNHHTLAVDPYHWNTGDLAYYGSHYYSIQAPGQSLVGVPIFGAYVAVSHLLLGGKADPDLGVAHSRKSPSFGFIMLDYVETIYTVALPAVLYLLLFFWFLGYFTPSIATRSLLTLALGLATDTLSYAQVLYSHVPAAALLFAGFVIMYVVGRGPAAIRGPFTARLVRHPAGGVFVAALLLGLAVTFDYETAIISVLVALYAAARLPGRLWPWLIAGALPGLLIISGFNYLAYHNPMVSAFGQYTLHWKLESTGFAGFSWPPRWPAIIGTSISPYRGLFFLSPFLLLAFPGYARWLRRPDREATLCFAVPMVYFLATAMLIYWHEGSTVGPRYFVPILPFLALPIVFVLDRVRSKAGWAAVYTLIALSVANVWVQTLGGRGGYPSESISNPLVSYSLPAIIRGDVHTSLGTALLAPFTGPHSGLASMLPLLLILGAWTIRCRSKAAQLNRGALTAASARERTPAPAEP